MHGRDGVGVAAGFDVHVDGLFVAEDDDGGCGLEIARVE